MRRLAGKRTRREPPTITRTLLGRSGDTGEARDGVFGAATIWVLVAVLALVVGVSYIPALSGEFVWDDDVFADETGIHDWAGLLKIWLTPSAITLEGHYWPLVYTSFWLEHKLWGLEPAGYHASNLLLHFINTLLLWRLLGRLAAPGAFLVAAVFAAHPMHVDSVAWIIERKDLLSALFYLIAALAWLRFTDSRRPVLYALALALYVAALLSKSVAVTLPAALLILHWYRDGRVGRNDLLLLIPFFAVGAGITAADLSYYGGREQLDLDYSLLERALIASRALWFYAAKLAWPAELAIIYPRWEVDVGDPWAWAFLVGAAALAAFLWIGRRRIGRGPIAGALYFAVTLSPTLGFVDFGFMQFSFVADRFQYLAGIGVLAVLVGAATRVAEKLPRGPRMGAWGAGALIVGLLGALTWRQAGAYQDDVTFFEHIVAHNPAARHAHRNLSIALFEEERFEESLAAIRVAVELGVGRAASLGHMASVERELGQLESAAEHLRAAIEAKPNDADLLLQFAELRQEQQRQEEANDLLNQVRGLRPGGPKTLNRLAEGFLNSGRYEEALEIYRAGLEIDAGFAPMRAGMGAALFELRRYEEALGAMERALVLDPDLHNAGALHAVMGRAARELGQLDSAAAHLQRAIESEPDDTEHLIQLAEVQHSRGRQDDADQLLGRVRSLGSDDPSTLHVVAESLRRQGRHEDAISAYRSALAIDPEFAPAMQGVGIALYRAGRLEEAAAALALATAQLPEPPEEGAPLPILLGKASEALGQFEAAAEFYAGVARAKPDDAAALDLLAAALFREQRFEEALHAYQALVEIDPEDALSHSKVAAVLFKLERIDAARRSIERALSLDPNLEHARMGLEILRAHGRGETP